MARMDSFLELVAEQRASDLHFHAGNPPLIRHLNQLVPIPFRVLSDMETRRFLMEIMTPEQRAHLETDPDLDFIYDLPGVARFRVNVFQQMQGMGAVFRIVPNRLPTLDELDFPPVLKKLANLQNGLVLVTGPTGSGKTTTLAAVINELNTKHKRHIITVEDPIEFVHPPKESKVTQRQVGKHVSSFAEALRSALRESPDVLVVGEMRDMETISLALSAAETGVLVFGTLHTNSAARSVDRIVDAMPDESRDQIRGVLSVLLRGVVSQQLARSADQETRVALLEILLNNYAVANMIREGKTYQVDSYLQSVSMDETEMTSMDQSIVRAIKEGRADVADAMRFASNHDLVKRLLGNINEDQ